MNTLTWLARRPCGCCVCAVVGDRLSRDALASVLGDWQLRGWTVERSALNVHTVVAVCEHERNPTQGE